MTPLQIAIMFHYYTTPEPYMCKTNTHTEQRCALIKVGMLNDTSEGVVITSKGKFWCEYVIQMPLPIEQFVIPRNEP